MRVKLEPKRFKRLLESCYLKPLIDVATMKFEPKGVLISDIYMDCIVVHMKLKEKFFLEYESKKEEIISIPNIILDRLGWGFDSESIEFYTKGDNLYMKGEKDFFITEQENSEIKKLPFTLKEGEYGVLPEKLKLESGVRINAKDLKLPPGEEYIFELKDKKLSVSISDSGNFERDFKIKPLFDKDIRVSLRGDYYDSIVNNLDGDVYFMLNQHLVVFSEKRKDYTKTYILTTMSE